MPNRRQTPRPADAAARAALGRIRKLLALAADQRGTPEGESAARIARRLIARYDLAGQDLHAPVVDPIARIALDLDGSIRWRRKLAAAVARHCACVLSWSPGEGRAWIYGRCSGVAVAEYLLVLLQREVEQAAEKLDDERPMMVRDTDWAQRRADFCGSAVLAVENRLLAMRQDEQRAEPEQCALVQRRADELRDWLEQQGMAFKKGAPDIFRYDPQGYAAGNSIALRDAVRGETPDEPATEAAGSA